MCIYSEETHLACNISQFGRAGMVCDEQHESRGILEDLAIRHEVVLACFIITIIDIQHTQY